VAAETILNIKWISLDLAADTYAAARRKTVNDGLCSALECWTLPRRVTEAPIK
jgi:hypothetical protein